MMLAKAAESPDYDYDAFSDKYSKERKQVENPVFNLETILLHQPRAILNFQQTTTAHEVFHMNRAE